ncbi:MAG: VWA domain-containing protein [Thermoanaerobaculia bacterium]|nr:VWA domain-containing protein [Thermoanaerobaculia bacterium]
MRRFLLKLFPLLGLVLLAVPFSTSAQEQPPEGPTIEEEIEVTEVLLDVLVTDAQGNVIVGLDEEDFVVREDGEPVELSGVTFYSNRRLLERSGAQLAADEKRDRNRTNRYFVLFFHDRRQDLPETIPRLLEAGRSAEEWVRTDLLPNDWVAVVGYDQKLELFQDFTTDTDEIVEAIDAAVQGKDVGKSWPSRTEEPGPGTPTLADRIPTGKELQKATYDFHKGVTVLARALDPILGRKNLLLFSFGFGDVDSFGNYSTDPRWYPPMEQALNDANVAVYPIHLFATRGGAIETGSVLDDALSQIADDTGGRFFEVFTSFDTPLEQVEEENNGYYLLSYRSRHPAGESGFQTVEVETTNPQFRLKHREGYTYGDPAN